MPLSGNCFQRPTRGYTAEANELVLVEQQTFFLPNEYIASSHLLISVPMSPKLIRLVLLLALVALAIGLLWVHPLFWQGLVLILGVLTLLWLLSLALKDASIVDVFWGIGFGILAWFYHSQLYAAQSPRSTLLCMLVSIWGLRLGLHIGIRNHGKGEDYRYQAWRREAGGAFWWISYFRVFVLQGVLMWLIASPLLIAQTWAGPLHWLDYLGCLLWLLGFGMEALGDWQLTQFRRNPANQGQVLDTGLWRYTRHPNYFGDALLWWGYFCFALTAGGYWYVFSPLMMTFLLMRVSGVTLLEQKLKTTRPQYRAYIERTSAFFPRPPKS